MARSLLAICLMFIIVAVSTLYEAQGHFLLKDYLEKFPSKSSEFKPFAFKGMIGFGDNLEDLCPVKEEYKEFFTELKGFMSFINSASGSSSEFNSKLKAQSEGLFKAISTLSGKAGSSGDTSKLIESLTLMGKTLAGFKRTGSQTITSDQRKKLMKSMVKWAKGIGKFVKKVGKKSGDANIDLSALGIKSPSESGTPSSDTGSPSAETGGPATNDSPADDSGSPNSDNGSPSSETGTSSDGGSSEDSPDSSTGGEIGSPSDSSVSSGDSSMGGGTSDAGGPSGSPTNSATAARESSMGGGSSPDTQDASGDGGSPSGSPTNSLGSGENSIENENAGGETSGAGGPSGSTSDMSTEGTSSMDGGSTDGGTSGGSTDNSAAGESSMNGGGSYSDTTGGNKSRR